MPIIIPVTSTRRIECITQNGTQYCEKKEYTKQETGFVLIFIVVLMCYLVFLMWLSDKFDHPIFLIAGILLPLLITGIVLIF